jgi:hypothetical protein
MSLAKAVPDGLKDQECKKIALPKCPPTPYVPEKDCVQETVSSFKDNLLKMQIAKGTKFPVPVWHSTTCVAFLIHMGSALEVIKKKKYFKAHEGANKAYLEQHKLAKQTKAHLAGLDRTTKKATGSSKKSTKRPKENAAVAN